MRGREFLMKDAYSFDVDAAGARHSYNKMFVAYLRTFARMELKAIPMRADTGPIGGDLSHEFIILAETGESAVHVERDFLAQNLLDLPVDYDDVAGMQAAVDRFTGFYAATDEKHDPAVAARLGDRLVGARGIEVGHIFYFGTKYSAPMKAVVAGPDGQERPVHMGSYGIGPSRLAAALIEASHDEQGIIWPDAVAPFRVALINLKVGDSSCDTACETVYRALGARGVDVLYDDREERPGAKFATADLVGMPWQVLVGPKGLAEGKVELKRRATGERTLMSIEDAVVHLAA
jgi:prolyl-tRNA synthetase